MGGYYLLKHVAAPFTGYHVYRKFSDANCTAPLASNATGYSHWEGLDNDCTNTTQ